MEKPLSSGHSGPSLFPNLFSPSFFLVFAFLSLFLLQTLSFFLPHDYLSFSLECHGRHCPVFKAACLQFFGLSGFASSPVDQSSWPQKWACSFQGLALEIPNFPFQWLWASALQQGRHPKPAFRVTQRAAPARSSPLPDTLFTQHFIRNKKDKLICLGSKRRKQWG